MIKQGLLLCLVGALMACQGPEKSQPKDVAKKTKPAVLDPLRGYVVDEFRNTSRAGRYEGWLVGESDRFAAAIDIFEITTGKYQAILSVQVGDLGRQGFVIDNLTMSGRHMKLKHPFLIGEEWRFDGDVLSGELATRGDTNKGRIWLKRRGHGTVDASKVPASVTT